MTLAVAGSTGLAGCSSAPTTSASELSTTDRAAEPTQATARDHFDRGWSLIMDEGRWTASEAAFRAAMAADPDWVLGRTLVARITQDADERRRLMAWIEANRADAPDDERLLIDSYFLGLEVSDARARGVAVDPAVSANRATFALAQFRRYLQIHPEDPYVSAELVEWIHNDAGAEAALAAIDTEVDPVARNVPFYSSYRATLLTELGRTDDARAEADRLESVLGPDAPRVWMLRGRIRLAEGDRDGAREAIATAVELDPRNLIAVGALESLTDSSSDDGT